MHNRALTARENTLIVVLSIVALFGIYYIFVFDKVRSEMDDIELQTSYFMDEKTIKTAVLIDKNAMEEKVNEMLALPQSEISVLPTYDNEEKLLRELAIILKPTFARTIHFDPIQITDDIVRRKLSITFSIQSYESLRKVVDDIHNTGYRFSVNELQFSSIDELQVLSIEENESYSVSLGITFFEMLDK